MKKITLFKKGILFILVFVVCSTFSFAQNNYTIQFQDESYTLPENIDSFQWSNLPEDSRLQEGYYGWIQFYETPTQNIQNSFKANNLQLLEYIPHKAYLFYFPSTTSVEFLRNNGVRSIVSVPSSSKLSQDLKNGNTPQHALQGDNFIVTLEYHATVSSEFVINDLATKQISLQQQYKGANIVDLVIPNNCLEALASLPYVKWVEYIVAPDVPDDTRGRSLHRANGLDTQTTSGRNYTGDGIGVMVRDDGIVGPHIDFQGRIDNSATSDPTGSHGDGVAGIMAGAGNLDPTNRGMAAGSSVYIVNYVANFLDSATQNLINNGDVQITNSSYSNGCNAGYTTITRTVDQQTRNNSSLLHVFSAGNSNNNDCGYGAGTQWGNITGGHKQGKNVIATANTFFDGSLASSSSRGPAHDGRIKPDIAANGANHISTDPNNEYSPFGGTSGAAPGIAGIAAQLYEAYGNINSGAFPPSGLIKAALLNTANDAGNVGPDYRFGWGIVNGLRAGKLIEDQRHLSDDITQGSSNTHTISVPAGTAQVRFMVYWTDPEAASGANPALVNDLDMVVTDPSSTDYLPYILDPTPNPSTLNLPATNGADHLNNVEQVVINSPAAGDYDIEISGFNVPVGPQEYFVLYEIIEDNLTLTYPNAGESFVPGETESIHWDSYNTGAGFVLEYSTDNGGTWNPITTVGSTTTNYGWLVPSEITGEALIRITSGAFQDQSDENFSIADQVNNLEYSQVCPSDITFTWDAVTGAEEYDVYLLGAMYMEIVGTSTTNTITAPVANATDTQWAAIVAKNNTEGWTSRRTVAINHPGGLLNCALANDIAVDQINNTATDFATVCSGSNDVAISATIQNTGIDPQSNFSVSYQIDNEPIVTETFTNTLNSGQQEVFNFSTPASIGSSGEYTLTVSVDLTGDQNPNNDQSILDFFAITEATALNFAEPFDVNGVPPSGWTIINIDNSTTWVEQAGITGSDGNSTTTAYVNNFNYNAPGQEDIITTEVFDLTNASGVTASFDLAKAQYSSTLFDGLRVEASADCGATYTTVYEKSNLDLSTIGGYTTSIWTPSSASNWRNEQIDLSDFEGGVVTLRFINVNGYGNSTFIDNINVEAGILGVNDVTVNDIVMYPNPAKNEVFIKTSTLLNDVTITLTNSLGQRILTINEDAFEGSNQARLNTSSYASGLYFVTIKSGNTITTKKLLIR